MRVAQVLRSRNHESYQDQTGIRVHIGSILGHETVGGAPPAESFAAVAAGLPRALNWAWQVPQLLACLRRLGALERTALGSLGDVFRQRMKKVIKRLADEEEVPGFAHGPRGSSANELQKSVGSDTQLQCHAHGRLARVLHTE